MRHDTHPRLYKLRASQRFGPYTPRRDTFGLDDLVCLARCVHGQVVTYTCHTCGTVKHIPATPVLDPDAPTEDPTLSNDTGTANPPSLTAAGPSAVAGENETSAMDVDSTIPQSSAAQARRVRKSCQPVPRMPPLFERKGHVIFRGNEVLTQ